MRAMCSGVTSRTTLPGAHDQRMIGDRLALGDQRSGADQAVPPDGRAAQDRTDAHQRAVADGAAVQRDHVGDRHAVADHQRIAGIGVQHAAVLDVRPRAHADRLVVAAQDAVPPDAGVVAEPAYGLAPDETQALIERGWKGPKTQDGFKNHGQRTRTMVALAKQLGYSARVGAMQTIPGRPTRTASPTCKDQLAEARASGNQTEVERLEAELDTAIAAAKPGKGPDNTWATADLDVNDDGIVDGRDLEGARRPGGDTRK